jgi:hypothetical protein
MPDRRPDSGSGTIRRRWLAAWAGGALLGIANGVAREVTYGRRLGEQRAHQLSVLTGIAAFAAYFWVLQRRWPLESAPQARRIGASWTGLTIAFEFGFGRLVAGQPWEKLLADYDLRRGRLWPLFLLWLAAGPELVRRLQRQRELRPGEAPRGGLRPPASQP